MHNLLIYYTQKKLYCQFILMLMLNVEMVIYIGVDKNTF